MLKRIFFWGIYVMIDRLTLHHNVVPSKVLKATLHNREGKLCFFNHLSNDRFIRLLASLSQIEGAYTVIVDTINTKEGTYTAYLYFPYWWGDLMTNRKTNYNLFVKCSEKEMGIGSVKDSNS